MDEIRDPGAPRTDEPARNAARNTLADIADRRIEGDALAYAIHRYIADSVVNTHTVTWERDVDSAGVPVRRYVLRGAWEVDPEPPAQLPQPGDVVRFRTPTADGEENGEWLVRSRPYLDRRDAHAILLLTKPGWAPGTFLNATAAQVEIVRRPSGAVKP